MLPLLPDTVAVVRDAWLAQPSVTAIVGGRVSARINGTVWPQLIVSTVDDGEAADPTLGVARVQNDCWGAGATDADTAAARLLARTLRAAARDLKGTYPSGTVVDCAPLLFIAAPDPTTGRARFILDLQVRVV